MPLDLFILVVALVINVGLGVLVIRVARRGMLKSLFLLLTIASIGWMITNYLSDHPLNYGMVLISIRLTFLFPVLFLWLLLLFSSKIVQRSLGFLSIVFSLLPVLLLSGLILNSNLIIKEIHLATNGLSLEFGNLGYLYLIYFIFFIVAPLIILIRKRNQATGLIKFQINSTLIGLGVFVLLASISNLFIPYLWNVFEPSKYGPIFSTFFVIGATRSLVKYRFLDSEVKLKKSTIETSLVSVCLVTGFLLIFILTLFFSIDSLVAALVSSMLIGALYPILAKSSKRFLSWLFWQNEFQPYYDYSELEDEIPSIDNRGLQEELNKISKDFGLKDVVILLHNHRKGIYFDYYPKGRFTQIDANHPIFSIMSDGRVLQYQKLKSIKNIKRKDFRWMMGILLGEMKRNQFELIAPIGNGFFGVVIARKLDQVLSKEQERRLSSVMKLWERYFICEDDFQMNFNQAILDQSFEIN